MDTQSAPTALLVTTETFSQWINLPLVNALIFGLAGSFFVALYVLRRIRNKNVVKEI